MTCKEFVACWLMDGKRAIVGTGEDDGALKMFMRLVRELFGAPERKASPVAQAEVTGYEDMEALSFTFDRRALGDAVYRYGIIQACIEKVSGATGGCPWVVKNADGDVVRDGPLAGLLKRPNDDMDWASFITQVDLNYLVFGDSYIHVVRRGGAPDGQPIAMWPLKTANMVTKRGQRGEIARWEYGGGIAGEGRKVIYRPGDGRLIHIHRPNLNSSTNGSSMLPNAMAVASIINMYSEKLFESLQGGVNSPAVLVVSGRDKDARIPDESRRKITSALREFVTGRGKAGQVATLYDADVKKVELNRKAIEADDMTARDSLKREVCFMLGVPPVLLGLKQDSTYNNYHTALMAFYTDTILPMHVSPIASAMTHAIGGDMTITVDADSIPALERDRMERVEKAKSASFLTINERRAMVGYPPVDGGDVILQPATVEPLASIMSDGEADPGKAADLWPIKGGLAS